ncbi:MAG: TlpA disulfide reductase family protein [Salinimicrobium sp.]
MKFLKKNWSNILLILFLLLMFIPQTRKPVQIALNRLISFSPSEISEANREDLEDYNWQLFRLDGQQINFRQSKGEVAVINLWATWCPPCIAEMPSFQELHADYGQKVDFYFISSEEPEAIKSFLQKKELNIPVYLPLSAGPEQMQSNTLPTTYVISREGKIVVKKTGSANWNAKSFRSTLDGLLGQ